MLSRSNSNLLFYFSVILLIKTYEFFSSFQDGTKSFYKLTALTAESRTAVLSSIFSKSYSYFSFIAFRLYLTLCWAFIYAKYPSSALIIFNYCSNSYIDSNSFLRIDGFLSACSRQSDILFFNWSVKKFAFLILDLYSN